MQHNCFTSADFWERNLDGIMRDVYTQTGYSDVEKVRRVWSTILVFRFIYLEQWKVCFAFSAEWNNNKKSEIIAAWDGLGQCCQTLECQLNIQGKLNKLHHSCPCDLALKFALWKSKCALSEEKTKDQICWCKHILLPAQSSQTIHSFNDYYKLQILQCT